MQSTDKDGNIVGLTEVDMGNINELTAQIKEAESKGAVSHTIGKLPKAGTNVEINNLSYRVEFADFVKGKFIVKLILRGE